MVAYPAGDKNLSLLNTRQAAEMLNVSEVSIRRWTTAGSLACVRLGAKRERRFRREDLLAFLESNEPSGQPSTHTADVVLEGLDVEHGAHLCTIYENDLGRLKLSVPLLADGLRSDALCLLVGARDAKEPILERLAALHEPLAEDIRAGRLLLSDGGGSARQMLDDLETVFVTAVSAGRQAIRLVGDMAWSIERGMDLDELMAFETGYNHDLARRFPVVSLCQYDARRFSGIGILRCLKCHEDTYKFPLARFLN